MEFIESYWTGGELGSDYQWSDNHGELVRCKDCKHFNDMKCSYPERGTCDLWHMLHWGDWFCADGERKSEDEILMEEMDADPLG